MTISFQTLAVGTVVTAAHLAVIIAIKPATLEALKYFQALELDSFVEEVLVKHDAPVSVEEPLELIPEVLAEVEVKVDPEPEPEKKPAAAEKKKAPLVVPESTVEFAESFIDLEEERDSMKAVTDVRVFSGRVERPSLRREEPVEAAVKPVAKPLESAAEVPVVEKAAASKPATSGPFNLREIRPVSQF